MALLGKAELATVTPVCAQVGGWVVSCVCVCAQVGGWVVVCLCMCTQYHMIYFVK